MKNKLTAALLTLTLVCTDALSGCVTAAPSAEEGEKGITVAISSDTGTMDPAGSIALTYLAYSVSALDSCSRIMKTVRSSTGRRKATR